MDDLWFVVFIAAFIVALVGYYLWRSFFMKPEDASEVGAAGTAPDFHQRREHTERERTRGTEEPGTPLS